MSVRTASGGKVEWALNGGTNFVELPEVRVWNMNIADDAKEYASSSTGGGKRRIAGAEDFTGTISIYVDRTSGTNLTSFDTDLGIKRGATGTFKLYEDETNYYTAPAYISNASVSADIEGGGIVPAEISFARDGALVYPTN